MSWSVSGGHQKQERPGASAQDISGAITGRLDPRRIVQEQSGGHSGRPGTLGGHPDAFQDHVWSYVSYLRESSPAQTASPGWQGQLSTLKPTQTSLPETIQIQQFSNIFVAFSKRSKHPFAPSFSLMLTNDLNKKASNALKHIRIFQRIGDVRTKSRILVLVRFYHFQGAFGSKVGDPHTHAPRRPRFDNPICCIISLYTFEEKKLQIGNNTFLEAPQTAPNK